MKTTEEILSAIKAALPKSGVEIVMNPSVSGQHSLRIEPADAVAVASFLSAVCQTVSSANRVDAEKISV